MVKKISKPKLMENELMKFAKQVGNDGGDDLSPFIKSYFEQMMRAEGRIKHKGEWLTEEEIFYKELEALDEE